MGRASCQARSPGIARRAILPAMRAAPLVAAAVAAPVAMIAVGWLAASVGMCESGGGFLAQIVVTTCLVPMAIIVAATGWILAFRAAWRATFGTSPPSR